MACCKGKCCVRRAATAKINGQCKVNVLENATEQRRKLKDVLPPSANAQIHDPNGHITQPPGPTNSEKNLSQK